MEPLDRKAHREDRSGTGGSGDVALYATRLLSDYVFMERVIAMDGNPFASQDSREDTSCGFFRRRDRKRIGKIVPGWHLQEGVDILKAASGKHFKQRLT